jgi:hypothetical protein
MFCSQVKKGPLAETSPMLNDISAVTSWSKVQPQMHVQTLKTRPLQHVSVLGVVSRAAALAA